MNSMSIPCECVLFLLITTLSSSSSSSSVHFNSTTILNVTSHHSLDQSLESFALRALTGRHHNHTGALYRANLPGNLSGIEVSVVRLTGKTLWNSGAKFSDFVIPARSVSVPPARRVAVVYRDLGNWSNHWYTVSGYRLVTSVLGFRVLDVSDSDNVREISLRTEKPIEVKFEELAEDPDEKMLARVRCVSYKSQSGEPVYMSRMRLPGVCYGSRHGDYSVVEPLEGNEKEKKNRGLRWLWAIGLVLGLGMLGFIGYVVVMGIRVLRSKKIQVMEREADDGEVFQSRWVGGSKMPSAAVTRTLPESAIETA
ncbi:PREDICTED: uncharacterized protein LOC104814855 isoform X2 [Tarenaya hassleriana]|uniref:uncharacterized protein LOC104814855 isoform X2 n=1 Tax=Tarenaya hassleriana TaxID=28532 RepID=UPI00053C20F6|nr:PREDICTED: uncharacterized protein LOC104814855 isoform X2 [Tarenaya hassleriana]